MVPPDCMVIVPPMFILKVLPCAAVSDPPLAMIKFPVPEIVSPLPSAVCAVLIVQVVSNVPCPVGQAQLWAKARFVSPKVKANQCLPGVTAIFLILDCWPSH